tara:strand:- start:12415 stop:13491 length:1077 start_codon:yes stop_codon:yes gene_type:complete
MDNKKKLLIAASGTGGHIYPALAVAERMKQNWRISWIGVPDRCESNLIPIEFEFFAIKASAPQSTGIKLIKEYLVLFICTFKVFNLIKKNKINLVFTTGGYISVPAILAAKLSGIPVVLHESNVIPGSVTSLLGKLCDSVALGFQETSEYLPKCETIFTGMPLRKEFKEKQPLPNWVPKGSGYLILILGGSQGSIPLNKMVRRIFRDLLSRGCRIIHIIGNKDYERYSDNHPNLIEVSFTENIPSLMQNADIVISRSGAGTIFELIACKVPSVLIPFPQSRKSHQEFNALFLAKQGGSIIVKQDLDESFLLKKTLFRILNFNNDSSNKTLFNMRNNMKYIFNNQLKFDFQNLFKNITN